MARNTYDIPESMRALTFQGKCQIEMSEVPTPKLIHPWDAIVRVALCGICGSDLHPYHERETGLARGTVVGHEFVGTIVALGSQVQGLELGDRVMSPFTTNCGACFYCRKGATCRCCHEQAHLFGWVSEAEVQMPADQRRGLHGSQAQFVRVPLAASTLVKVPATITDEEAVLLGDILSTAFFCAENGGVSDGSIVAVVGCGPVGLLAILAAQFYGAQKVFAVDGIASRLAKAEQLGAEPVNFSETNAVEQIRQATEGRGADIVLELVGSSAALRLAFDAVRPMGTLSSVGVHTQPQFPFSPVEGYDKNITYVSGRCPARRQIDKLIPIVASKKMDFCGIITHRMGLSEGVKAYELFDKKLDGCIKVMLDPWS